MTILSQKPKLYDEKTAQKIVDILNSSPDEIDSWKYEIFIPDLAKPLSVVIAVFDENHDFVGYWNENSL